MGGGNELAENRRKRNEKTAEE
jgi:hypothetical protein